MRKPNEAFVLLSVFKLFSNGNIRVTCEDNMKEFKYKYDLPMSECSLPSLGQMPVECKPSLPNAVCNHQVRAKSKQFLILEGLELKMPSTRAQQCYSLQVCALLNTFCNFLSKGTSGAFREATTKVLIKSLNAFLEFAWSGLLADLVVLRSPLRK